MGGGGFGPNEDSAEKTTEETVLDQLTRPPAPAASPPVEKPAATKNKENVFVPPPYNPHSHFLVDSRRS